MRATNGASLRTSFSFLNFFFSCIYKRAAKSVDRLGYFQVNNYRNNNLGDFLSRGKMVDALKYSIGKKLIGVSSPTPRTNRLPSHLFVDK